MMVMAVNFDIFASAFFTHLRLRCFYVIDFKGWNREDVPFRFSAIRAEGVKTRHLYSFSQWIHFIKTGTVVICRVALVYPLSLHNSEKEKFNASSDIPDRGEAVSATLVTVAGFATFDSISSIIPVAIDSSCIGVLCPLTIV